MEEVTLALVGAAFENDSVMIGSMNVGISRDWLSEDGSVMTDVLTEDFDPSVLCTRVIVLCSVTVDLTVVVVVASSEPVGSSSDVLVDCGSPLPVGATVTVVVMVWVTWTVLRAVGSGQR